LSIAIFAQERAEAREFDGPQTRRPVAIDADNKRARDGFLDHPPHRRCDDEMRLTDHALDLVRVKFGAAPVSQIGANPEEVLRLIDSDDVERRTGNAIA
jgi:hypothetical protein